MGRCLFKKWKNHISLSAIQYIQGRWRCEHRTDWNLPPIWWQHDCINPIETLDRWVLWFSHRFTIFLNPSLYVIWLQVKSYHLQKFPLSQGLWLYPHVAHVLKLCLHIILFENKVTAWSFKCGFPWRLHVPKVKYYIVNTSEALLNIVSTCFIFRDIN